MASLLNSILTVAEPMLEAKTPETASTAFYDAVAPMGASYLQTRLYRRPTAPLTSASHWRAGGFVRRISPEGWVGSAAFNYICFECNPLLNAIKSGQTRYRFSDFAPRADERYADYWDAMSEAGIHDALCATSYASGRRIASLHLGFRERSLPAEQASLIHLAGLMLTERILALAEPAGPEQQPLTPRERDCLAFVCDGKSDWEIGAILGISQSTAKFHVDNARRKLGAVNRAQAAAIFVASGMFGPLNDN